MVERGKGHSRVMWECGSVLTVALELIGPRRVDWRPSSKDIFLNHMCGGFEYD